MHDGSKVTLKKLGRDYDPTSRTQAMATLMEASGKGEFLTGLIYVNEQQPDFITALNLVDEPLATLPEARVRPGKDVLDKVMESLR
ncbi:2-oxoglutarate ferredoxin oxidoreductase subunit beta [compost metagenome]